MCRSYLCRTLRLTTHVSFLRSRSILSKEDDDDIKAEKGTLKQNEKFLDIISTKGPQGFDEFCNAIKDERTTGHVLEHINRELQTLSELISSSGYAQRSIFRGCLPGYFDSNS